MTKLADYDKYHYDYSQFWEGRKYEDQAERIALRTLLKGRRFENFVDIGGSYGRLTNEYYKSCKNIYIVDYSLETLVRNADRLKKAYPNVKLIAANAYHMPFKDNSFDGGIMVRVLHHLEDQKRIFEETHRTSVVNNLFILEYANKRNIKNLFRGLKTFKRSFLDVKPIQQPNQGNNEGTHGEAVVFLNYHPSYIKESLNGIGILIERSRSVSFLRSTPLTRLPLTFVLLLERILQSFFSWTMLAPSIFLSTTKVPNEDIPANSVRTGTFDRQETIICCPKCHGDLEIRELDVICHDCKMKYSITSNIVDLRYTNGS